MQNGFSNRRIINALVACCAFFLLVLETATCRGATRHVPSEYPTIKAGVLASQDGDTVIIADGIYTGVGNRDIPVTGKRVTVQSAGDPMNCVMDLEVSGRAFVIEDSAGFMLAGVTVRNGVDFSGHGGGELISKESEIRIEHCRFEYSRVTSAGGGALILHSGTLEATDVVFERNQSVGTWLGGGAITLLACKALLTNCVFTENQAREYPLGSQGGAIYSSGNELLTISRCIFERNDTDSLGSAIMSKSPTSIHDSQFRGNTSRYTAPAVAIEGKEVTIANCLFQSNNNAAIWHDSQEPLTLFNVLVFENGSGLDKWTGPLSVSYSTFADMYASPFRLRGTDAIIDSCIFWGLGSTAIDPGSGSNMITNSIVQGGFEGEGNLDVDPLFTTGPRGNYYLSQVMSGQFETSAGIDHSSHNANEVYFRTESDLLELDEMTTRSDDIADTLAADIGYHYQPLVYETPSGPAIPHVRMTQSHTVPIAGEEYRLDVSVFMVGAPAQYTSQPFVLILDVGDLFFWYPLFTENFQYQAMNIGPGDFSIYILQFIWPDIADPIPPITFYCAYLTNDLSQIFGDWDSIRLTP